MSSFEAQFHGICSDCEERIVPGDQIHWLGDGEYEHATCRAPQRPVDICSTCWLTKPCDCEAIS